MVRQGMICRRPLAAALATILALVAMHFSATSLRAADPNSYGAMRDLLAAHTNIVELTGENGERVAICPDYQGRIMTSTTGGLDGRSLGWINRLAIARNDKDPRFNNIGGEDRFWLAPEGGPHALFFNSPTEQRSANFTVPAALNDGPFKIASGQDEPYYRLTRSIQLQNASRTQFSIEVSREIRLQKVHHFGKLFGADAQAIVQSGRLKIVGFQTINSITNRGPAMARDKGLISIASVGQFNATPRTYVILPYNDSDAADGSPIVNTDYLTSIPADRLRVNDQGIFFLADGKFRSKIGVPAARAKPVAAAIDLEQGLLTLVHYTMPPEPAQFSYVDNNWGKQDDPFRGDVVNSYNDGPADGARGSLGYFELQSLSPAGQLPTGKTISHTHTTFHIEGDPAALARVAKAALGVDVRVEEVAGQKTRR